MPGLFGIKHSNKDLTLQDSWGKNQFSSTFPAALVAYMASKELNPVYLTLDKSYTVVHQTISALDLFGLHFDSDELFYAFESTYSPYEQFIKGQLPRIDLVTHNLSNDVCLKGLEIKLTALPDNSTCGLTENRYGTEIVIRRDTIVYLACGIASLYKYKNSELKSLLGKCCTNILDWTNAENVLPFLKDIVNALDNITEVNIDKQHPLVLQPLWKTEGKSPKLSPYCLDVFVWSNFALIELFIRELRMQPRVDKISRHTRTVVWLYKMLADFSDSGQFNHQQISDDLSYNTKNDKAFASSGIMTYPFMQSPELFKPRIHKDEIKNIILDGGQNLLSPERRFDAIIFNSPDLFD